MTKSVTTEQETGQEAEQKTGQTPNIELTITELKGQISIQDLGRPQAQHLGFSASGAADEFALLTANKLLNKPLHSAALEVIFGQVSLTVNQPCQLVLTGADCQTYLSLEQKSKQSLSSYQLYNLAPKQTLVLQRPKHGLVSYIAFNAQFNAPSFANSQAQTMAEQALTLTEPAIKLGSKLTLTSATTVLIPPNTDTSVKTEQLFKTAIANFYHYLTEDVLTLRFIASELWYQLDCEKQQQIINQEVYTVGASSNRMGYQLTGLSLPARVAVKQALSKPVCYGTIQLPNENSAIVLMKERQTIGGYPTLGTVIQTDLFRLSQLRPGQKVKLMPITTSQAQQQLISFYQKLD